MQLFKGLFLILLLFFLFVVLTLIYFKGVEGSIKLFDQLYNQKLDQQTQEVIIDEGNVTINNPELEMIEKEIALLLKKEKLEEQLVFNEYNRSLYILPNIVKVEKLTSLDLAKELLKQPKVKTKPTAKVNQIIVKEISSIQTKQSPNKKLWVKVDLSSQRMKVYKDGNLLYHWKVSTGRRGYSTPIGKFKPKYLTKMHYSRQYNNAPMPYSIFFHGGYACHGTKSLSRLGRRASHGCIRLDPKHAKKLYYLVQNVGKFHSTIEIKH